jgi:hypothetical protein
MGVIYCKGAMWWPHSCRYGLRGVVTYKESKMSGLVFGVLEWLVREFGVHTREGRYASEYRLWPLTLTYWYWDCRPVALATIDLGSREILRRDYAA